MLEFASDEAISGVYLQYFEVPYTCDIRVQQNGEWVTVASTGPYLSDWVPLPEGTNAVQLVNASRDKIYLSELTFFGAGDRPAYVPQWETLADCDLMLVSRIPMTSTSGSAVCCRPTPVNAGWTCRWST